MSLFRTREKSTPETTSIVVDGREIAVTLKRNARARRLILRPDAAGTGASVTLPPGSSTASALAFVEERSHWLMQQLDRYDAAIPFRAGERIPYLGEEYEIRQSRARRGTVICEDGLLFVSGGPEHLARRLTDWFKAQARERISRLADEKTSELNLKRGRISIRDTRSRWGSCSSTGSLNFSWRLIMAPEWVLDYVVAHEVSHLVEHNHSPAFWAVVDTLTMHASAGRKWLSDNGGKLHRYG